MKSAGPLFCLLLFSALALGCEQHEYLGQTPPGDVPKVFAPGVISLPDRKEEVITFSNDLKEIYYSIEYYPVPKPSFTMYMKYENGQWSKPDTASFSKGRRTSEPFMAFGGSRIYYFANQVEQQKGALDLCYSEKSNNGWTEPVSLSAPPNALSPYFTLHPCVVADTSIYFSSYSGNVSVSRYNKGAYAEVETLPAPINHMNLKEEECWGDPFVSPDESFLIFRSNRAGGYGGSDLYIAFKTDSGDWSKPQNLGPKINSEYDELGGDITPDSQYMTFGRNGDIYWVSTSFIKRLKAKMAD